MTDLSELRMALGFVSVALWCSMIVCIFIAHPVFVLPALAFLPAIKVTLFRAMEADDDR